MREQRQTSARATGTAGVVLRFTGRRLLLGLLTLLIVSFLVFTLTQALPGDIARQILGQNATETQLENLRAKLGLDQHFLVQYLNWLMGVLRLDFGQSLASGTPVSELLAVRTGNTATIVVLALLVSLPLAIFLGGLAASRSGRFSDHVISGSMFAILSLPEFVVGVILILLFAGPVLKLFPPASILDPRQPALEQPELIVLPCLTMILIALPHLTESVKTLVRDELSSEHVLWARLYGIRQPRILARGVVPNVASPTSQIVATTINFLLGGSVAVETVFGFPGLGSALVAAVSNRDIVVVQGIAIGIAAFMVLAFLIADLIGLLTTPKLRTGTVHS